MKKLFLTSSFCDVYTLLPDFVGESIVGKRITVIPTAAKHNKKSEYILNAVKALEQLGFTAEFLDIDEFDAITVKQIICRNDAIYISGGNTFYLLQELKKKNADKVIIQEINAGKLYIGESAGSIITSPDIGYVCDMDDCAEAAELKNYFALGVVDFYPLPHYKNAPFIQSADIIKEKFQNKVKLVAFSNNQVIEVKNGSSIVKTLAL